MNALLPEWRRLLGSVPMPECAPETAAEIWCRAGWWVRSQGQLSHALRSMRGDGLIEEMTVFFRPLPATTAAMRQIGRGLGRRKSKLRGRLINTMTAPLALMTRAGDRLGVRLLQP